MKRSMWFRLGGGLVIGGAALIGFLFLTCRLTFSVTEYRRFPSPDGRYTVIVCRIPSCLPMIPGQAGDAKGLVRLVDHEGKILKEKPVEMVNTVDRVEWNTESVFIPLFAEWPLEQPSGNGRP